MAFLPPYSPDFNPIEEVFSIIKHLIKKNNILASKYQDYLGFLNAAVEASLKGVYARNHFFHTGIGDNRINKKRLAVISYTKI